MKFPNVNGRSKLHQHTYSVLIVAEGTKRLENKNIFYVQAWNDRVLQPQRFSPNLYEMQINYQQSIDYGYEVNYKLYNYFIYFQNKYKQNLLGGRVPVN